MNVFKNIIRKYRTEKATSLVHMLGFAFSLSIVVLLAAYNVQELKTNSFINDKSRVFLAIYDFGPSTENPLVSHDYSLFSPQVLADVVLGSIPQVERFTRINSPWEKAVVQSKQSEPIETEMIYADSSFLSIFGYETVYNKEDALVKPMSIVLSQYESHRLFGNKNPLGKTVLMDNKHVFTVTDIIKAPKYGSSIKFNCIASHTSLKTTMPGILSNLWTTHNFLTFVKIKPGSDHKQVASTIKRLMPNSDDPEVFVLLPVDGLYLNKNIDLEYADMMVQGNADHIRWFWIIGGLILVIASINYINLNLVKRLKKSKDIGILKVVGANQKFILFSLVVESVVNGLAALVFAYVIAYSALPLVNIIFGLQLVHGILFTPEILFSAVLLTLFSSILISLAPAIIYSSVSPIHVFNPLSRTAFFKMPGQKILTIIQLFVIIFLISFTIMVRKQVFYSINNLGYTKDNILEIELTPQLKKNVLQNELSKIPGFQSASFTNFGAGKDFPLWGSWMNNNGEEVKVSFYVLSCDPEFFEIMDIKCKKGRLFKKEMDNRDAFIVNETFVKHYGLEKLQETSIQARLRGNGGPNPIIGVVEDFNYYSVHRPISPLAIHCSGHDSRCLVKFSTSNFEELKSSYDKVNTICKKLSPAYPVTVDFLDKKITYMYRSEQRFQKLFTFFSISSIIIACMGIFSLLLYVIEMKIKEIGIRKINGAKIHEILTMLNTDFVKWVTIAFVIACPIGWYAMKRWLENFAYKTEISWWIFALSGAIAMVIALVTVSFQSYRAASKNPVESLRYE